MVANMATKSRLAWVGWVCFGLVAGGISSATWGAEATTRPSGAVLDPAIATIVKEAVAGETYERSDLKGGAFTKRPFEDISPDGVLIGLRIGLGSFFTTEVVKYIQPIYLTPQGEKYGHAFGNLSLVERTVTTKAPAGYAIGALDIKGGGGLDAITVTYMKFNGTRLDPTEAVMSHTFGGGKGGGGLLDGDGTPVIGICGRIGDDGNWMALGLVLVKPTAMVKDDSLDQLSQRSDIKGGAFGNHPFQDVSQDGVLIGFRIGIGSSFGQDVIRWIEPIYQTRHGEESGNGLGNEDEVERRMIAKAPEGYAVGALKVKGGGGLDAISVTYMRFNGTRLDPTDVQVTPRIGGGGGGGWTSINGDGTPIIGICGRQNDDGDWLGLGLIFAKPTVMVDGN
jgi:hypothetical protein